MADNEGKANEEMVSWFIIGTCQMIPKTFPPAYDQMNMLFLTPNLTPKEYSISCGSLAEFYIRPLNTCIDDFDVLTCNNCELAFSGDVPVFPSDMSRLAETIMSVKIEPNHKYPGFVRLRVEYEMEYNWKYKNYEVKGTALPGIYIALARDRTSLVEFRQTVVGHMLPNIVQGPAIRYPMDSNFVLGGDRVLSIFCPQWPTQARDWPGRARKHGWPKLDTISEVVQNGCHVVYVQHRSCRDDRNQWRLSFSLAEVILLQSWTHFQQIVYHLLRFFAKRELIHKECPKEDEVLCPYHLKTLILWSCEEMPPDWWNSSSIIAICCELLEKLSEWLKRGWFPNYFIPEANLFHVPLSSTILPQTEERLQEFRNPESLCQWFLQNYILPITRTQLHFFSRKSVEPCFIDYLLPLIEYRKESELECLDICLSFRFLRYNTMSRCIRKSGLSSDLRQKLTFGRYTENLDPNLHNQMTYFPTIERVVCFKYYDNLVHILHAAYGLEFGEISLDSNLFVEFVKAISMQPNKIRSQYHNFPKTNIEESSRFHFLRAQSVMEHLTGSNRSSEFQLLSLTSKEFLRKTLEYDDSQLNGIAPAALSYLAGLHFATSEFQQASGFCLPFIADQTALKENETLNACCLLFIDDIAKIVGLCVLLKKIADKILHYINGRLYLDMRLSPDVFAYYLKVLSVKRKGIFKHDIVYSCNDLPDSAFPMDEYLRALLYSKYRVSMQFDTHCKAARPRVRWRTVSLTDCEATSRPTKPLTLKDTVVDSLMGCALENMTSFYGAIRNDFGVSCNTADCYRALYLYKCRQYDQVLHLCERILHAPELQSDLKKFAFANVLVLPPLDSLFDEDVISLLGFHTLVYYLSPHNDNLRKLEVTDASIFSQCFASNSTRYSGLSNFLHNHYSVKCHYFIGRKFLARYLKVRCCIDSNAQYAKELTKFTIRKATLPFERIIRRFLIRKLRAIK